jgi:hypothetical protein
MGVGGRMEIEEGNAIADGNDEARRRRARVAGDRMRQGFAMDKTNEMLPE